MDNMEFDIGKYLRSIGLDFPKDEEELLRFNEIHKDYPCTANEDKIDPTKILQDIKQESQKETKPSRVDYHKRIVLAAEIVSQLPQDSSLGHLKLQKLIFLCQNALGMNLSTNFLQQRMGPFDPQFMRSIDSQFKKREWFEYQQNDFPKYKPLEKQGGHKEWFNIYFADQKDSIHLIIQKFKSFKTYQIELVATLYACWLNAVKQGIEIEDNKLIERFYEWHESKSKFPEKDILKAIEWMKGNSIYPMT